MHRRTFPGGWYVSALPSGEYAVLFPGSHLDTHLGSLPFPSGEGYGPMFLDISTIGGFRIAGLAHDTVGRLVEWYEGQWHEAKTPFQTGRIAYDHVGIVCDLAPAGVQFVDDANRPVSRLDTYGPHRGLSEWVETAGLYLGQGHANGGVLVREDANLRVLDEGHCTFLRVKRQGERVAVSYVKSGTGAVIVQTTLSELRSLPILGTPAPNPGTPAPVPVPPSTPEPTVPEMDLPDDVYQIVVALHAKHPELAAGDDEQRRTLAKKIAQTVRARKGAQWGWKSAHSNLSSPAKDAIARIPDGDGYAGPGERQFLFMWDLFNGTTRAPHPQPIHSDTEHPEQFFIPVEPVDHLAETPAPTPDPLPAPPEEDVRLVARIAAMEGQLMDLLVQVAEVKSVAVRAASDAAVAKGKAQGIEEAVKWRLDHLRVEGSIGRSYGHAHSFSGKVVNE